jgi:molybdopterin-guanine dinucleotide biosynthesis protein A
MTPDIAAVVLAGGAGRRMGGLEKPLLDLAGRPILARIVATLLGDTKLVAINANGDPARFAAFGVPVLADEFAGEGPLAGVLAGMEWAAANGAAALLTVPGDTPFIPAGLALALMPPPACARSAGHAHHLAALWPVACRHELREVLSRPGRRDVAGFARRIGTRTVDFPVAAWDPFLNVNTPADLAAARRFAHFAGKEDPS